MNIRSLALLLGLLWGQAHAQSSLLPLPYATVDLGAGTYRVPSPEANTTLLVLSTQPLPIAAKPSTQVWVDLKALPWNTVELGGNRYRLPVGDHAELLILSSVPRALVPAPAGAVKPGAVTSTSEISGRRLPRLPGLPDDLTGSVTMVQRGNQVTFAYSLTSLGQRTFTLDANAIQVLQNGQPIRATLDRRSGNLTPGILTGGTGEIGRIRTGRVSSAPIELRWTIRTGDTSYTLSLTQ
ncbi:hypothetical protein [Deinococcus sp. Leaf326]|uniref:hypothetical protein n=1 Tax=Deinococcus sp. Leaf326 TaxID=1736338 RepID=UPI0006FA9A77|nr:hypothetical protein [Deinococcus sp. Leaf326]KQR15511.1 hypothetical protein ASF71_20315 [Deinococcus sp. Leaf326]